MNAAVRRCFLLGMAGLCLAGTVRGSVGPDWEEIEKITGRITELEGKRGEDQSVFGNLNLLSFRLADFIAAYPDKPRRWDAELLRLNTVAKLAVVNQREVDWTEQETGFAAVIAAPGANKETKVAAQAGLLLVRFAQLGSRTPAETRVAFAREVDEFYNGHRHDARAAGLAIKVAEWIAPADPDRAESILKKNAEAGDGELPTRAESLLRVVQAKRKPLEIAFTATDGRKVDLAALRGKVVLVDFWATWCPPCREETPTIVELHRRLHGRGFEVVGISLDDDKGKLAAYLKQNGMTWPQFYDGEGWDNKFARRFGIHSIPAMWLVNKQGVLVDGEGRDDLAEKVERLLAE